MITLNPIAAKQRFTRDGSDELENHLECTCHEVLEKTREIVPDDQIEALLLGGGYGRGEGGVLSTDLGDKPYNDLDFYLLLHGNRWLNERRYGARLGALGHALTLKTAAEVEITISSIRNLRRSPV